MDYPFKTFETLNPSIMCKRDAAAPLVYRICILTCDQHYQQIPHPAIWTLTPPLLWLIFPPSGWLAIPSSYQLYSETVNTHHANPVPINPDWCGRETFR